MQSYSVRGMKKVVHKAELRGRGEYDWLHTRYSFSFSEYYDPQKMGFGALRVLNDDVIDEGKGFDTHAHQDMEIITIVTQGELVHEDSTGVRVVLKEGDVQVMSAGTGIMHSEFNHSQSVPLALFQIWILPEKRDLVPRHDEKRFFPRDNSIVVLASGKDEGLRIQQKAKVSLAYLDEGNEKEYVLGQGQGLYAMVVEGEAMILGEALGRRDAIGCSEGAIVSIKATHKTTLLLIEVPMHP